MGKSIIFDQLWNKNIKEDIDKLLRTKIKLDPNSECWLWLGDKNDGGYGRIYRLLENKKKVKFLAHRYFYTFFKKPIDENLILCHKCDNPSCVNPEHLFEGTDRDNATDRKLKGRNRSLESYHSTTKLSWDNVNYIRAFNKKDKPNVILAKEFNVTPEYISHIRLGRVWKTNVNCNSSN